MVHIPSFLVGTAVTGTGFLLIHKELSHRERLSPKWRLMELAEDQLDKMIAAAKAKSITDSSSSSVRKEWVSSKQEEFKLGWNKGLESARSFLQENVFGESKGDGTKN